MSFPSGKCYLGRNMGPCRVEGDDYAARSGRGDISGGSLGLLA